MPRVPLHSGFVRGAAVNANRTIVGKQDPLLEIRGRSIALGVSNLQRPRMAQSLYGKSFRKKRWWSAASYRPSRLAA